MYTMVKAAVCHKFGAPLAIEEVRLAAPRMGQVEVTVDAVAICHSDISYADGAWGGSLPAVYGHEASGRISRIGSNVVGLSEGDPVIVTLIRSCGNCVNCASGNPTICETRWDQLSHPLSTSSAKPVVQGMNCGAFAEKVVVDASQVARIPADMPRDAACLLSCGVITGVGAVVYAADLRAGQDVVVIGVGGVGLNAIQGARIAGARRILAVDLTETKIEHALEFGATDGILATETAPWKAAFRAFGGKGAEAVLITVGAITAIEQAPRYLGRGGKAVLIGMPHSDAKATMEPVILAALAQGISGSKMGNIVLSRDIPWIIDMYRQKRLKLDQLISRRWTLGQINEAIADTKTGKAKRNVILM